MSDADPTVLVVDDDDDVRVVLCRLLAQEGFVVTDAADGTEALAAVAGELPDVVLLDVRMPGDLDGFDVCRRLRSDPATRLLPVVIVTGLNARNDRVLGIEAGADDLLTKPVDRDELLARVRSLIRLKRYTDDLDSAASIVMTLASMIEARDGYGDGHCHRMANYATRVGRALSLDEHQVRTLYRGAFLHDIGMLTIPEAVLRKPGALEPQEWTLLKSHTDAGDRLCGNLRSLQASVRSSATITSGSTAPGIPTAFAATRSHSSRRSSGSSTPTKRSRPRGRISKPSRPATRSPCCGGTSALAGDARISSKHSSPSSIASTPATECRMRGRGGEDVMSDKK